MICICDDWKSNIDAVNGPIVLQSIRGGEGYNGKKFVYCPWCGEMLHDRYKVADKSNLDWFGGNENDDSGGRRQ